MQIAYIKTFMWNFNEVHTKFWYLSMDGTELHLKYKHNPCIFHFNVHRISWRPCFKLWPMYYSYQLCAFPTLHYFVKMKTHHSSWTRKYWYIKSLSAINNQSQKFLYDLSKRTMHMYNYLDIHIILGFLFCLKQNKCISINLTGKIMYLFFLVFYCR